MRKTRHDETQVLYQAGQKGIQKGVSERSIEIARNLLKINLLLDQIVDATGLSQEDIKHLLP